MRGSITEPEQRSSLGFYLNLKIFLGALQLLCAIFGLISLTAQSGVSCNSTFEESDLTRAFITVVVVSSGSLLFAASTACCAPRTTMEPVSRSRRRCRANSWMACCVVASTSVLRRWRSAAVSPFRYWTKDAKPREAPLIRGHRRVQVADRPDHRLQQVLRGHLGFGQRVRRAVVDVQRL